MRRTTHSGSGSWFALDELLKLQERGQSPDESVKIQGAQIHSVDSRRTNNSMYKGNKTGKRMFSCFIDFMTVIEKLFLEIRVYFHQNKKRRGTREGNYHAKTMMRQRVNERIKQTLSMYRLDRTWRKKYEGRD